MAGCKRSRRGLFRVAVCTALWGAALAATACATSLVANYSPNLIDHAVLPYGLPECSGTFLNKLYYAICYDPDWRIPRWEGHYITPEDLQEQWPRNENWFYRDRELPSDQRSDSNDYAGSGYDRGHMAPAGDFAGSLAALRSTFVMSNMAPQTPELNRDEWRRVEHAIRDEVPNAKGALIYTGNLFLDEYQRPTQPTLRIGRHRVAVPTHCFKIVLIEQTDGSVAMYGFLLANSADQKRDPPLREYQLSVDQLERMTGLDFFPDNLDWAELEAAVEPWPEEVAE